ncbi:hypothetical protein [Bacteroides finegoldii]|uniref:hypothetical protein n=1 Tax=Bacteroides finegoldii TaxID=338188 RepID=UPI0011DE2288|nr:hypothetical protein [Bacteroides finegoldii]
MNLILSSLVARSSTTFEDFLLTDFVASEDSNLSRLTDLLDLPRLAYKKAPKESSSLLTDGVISFSREDSRIIFYAQIYFMSNSKPKKIRD